MVVYSKNKLILVECVWGSCLPESHKTTHAPNSIIIHPFGFRYLNFYLGINGLQFSPHHTTLHQLHLDSSTCTKNTCLHLSLLNLLNTRGDQSSDLSINQLKKGLAVTCNCTQAILMGFSMVVWVYKEFKEKVLGVVTSNASNFQLYTIMWLWLWLKALEHLPNNFDTSIPDSTQLPDLLNTS